MRYIGLVTYEMNDKYGDHCAWLEPRWDAEGNLLGDGERQRLFPQRGKVIWFNALTNSKGKLLYFTTSDPNPAARGQDQCQLVGETTPVFEVLSSLSGCTTYELGAKLQEESANGFRLQSHASNASVFLRCRDCAVGPIALLKDGDCYRLDSAQGLEEVPSYQGLQTLPLSGGGSIVSGAPTHNGVVDLRPNREVLQSVLKSVAKLAPSRGEKAQTRAQIQKLVEAYFPAQEVEGFSTITSFRVERIRTLIRDKAQAAEVLHDLQEELLQLPALKELQARAQEKGLQDGLTKASEQAEALTAFARAAAQAQKELADREEARLHQAKADLASLAESEQKLRESLREALGEPEKILASSTLLRPFLQSTSGATPVRSDLKVEVPWPTGAAAHPSRGALVEALEDERMSRALAWDLLAAFASGLVPLVVGPFAAEALSRFSRVALGGRCHRSLVAPWMCEPTDILARSDPARGRLLAHRSQALDYLARASSSQERGLLVLEGVNRAPTESFFLPLAEAAGSGGSLRLSHPALCPAAEAGGYPSQLAWPPNVLMAATLAEGPTVLPLSSACFAHGVVVDASSFLPRAPHAAPTVAEAPEECFALADSGCRAFCDQYERLLPVSMSPLHPFRLAFERFGQALLEVGVPHAEVASHLESCLTLPAALVLDTSAQTALAKAADPMRALEPRLKRVLL